MKKSCFYYFGLIALIISVSGCGDKSEKTIVTEPTPAALETPRTTITPEAPGEAATITFEEPVHDFGSVGPSTSHAFDFKFTNTGNAVLKIERFHAPCGCTIPEMAKREYAPGESGVLKVRYNASSSAVTDKKPIYVYTNDPKNPQYELTIKAKVEVNVTINPQDVSLLLDQENAGMPHLTVASKDGREFAITHVTSTNNAVTIPFDSAVKATRFELEPTVDLEKLAATPAGLVQIRTSHPQSGTLVVRFNAKPMFELSRPRIILQNIVPGEEVVRDVWIRSNYDKTVEIESYSSVNGMMTIESQKQEGNNIQLMVKITAPTDATNAGRRYITDELKIRLTSGQELSVRCSGWFKLK